MPLQGLAQVRQLAQMPAAMLWRESITAVNIPPSLSPDRSATSARCKTSYVAERLGSNIILPEKLQSSKPHVVYWCAGTLKLLDVNMFGWPAHTGRPAVATAADCCYACADTPGCNVSAAAAGLQTTLRTA